MRSWPLVVFGIILSILTLASLVYRHQISLSTPQPNPSAPGLIASPIPIPILSPGIMPSSLPPSPGPSDLTTSHHEPDLTTDVNGLSQSTVVLVTSEGTVKFKFYSNDAPQTVKRFVELIQKGFYNGLSFHRVIPGFVVQGGDPTGTGSGGSGVKLKAEFNDRKHIDGAVAMARASDPNSADSQFYISLGTHPHLDRNYTVFGQVIEGMDVVKKIKVGDKILSMTIQ